jgi:hypothetical protein
MKTQAIAIAFLLLFLPMRGSAQGGGHSAELELTSPRLIEVEPGKIVTASYLVSNRTQTTVDLMEHLDLPSKLGGWQPVVEYQRPIVLAAGERKVQLVTFIVPRNYAAGKYTIAYSIIDRASSSVVATETFSIVVKSIVKIDAVIENKPEIVLAGDEYNVLVRLINNGNSSVSMKARATSSPVFPVVMNPAEMVLKAGGSRSMSLSVKTDQAIRSRTNQVLEISLLAESPEGGATSLARTIFVEILPQLVASVDLRNKVPSRARFIVVGENEEGGIQGEYAGSGSLNESGTRRIDFLFRGPDIMDRSVYGTRDALHLDYEDRNISLLLGDRLYSLSPLAELLTYARGAEVSIRPGKAEIGSYYSQTRWDAPQEKEVAAYMGYCFGGAFKMRANFLNKQKDESLSIPAYRANIYSIQARINPSSVLDLGLEYARSYNEEDGGSNAFAHRAILDGRLRSRVWYTFENTYAAPEFAGYYRDAIYSSGTISADVYRSLRSHLSYRLSNGNLHLDPRQNVASRDRSYIGGLSYMFASGTSVSLDFETLTRKDEQPPVQFDFAEDIIRLGLGHTYRSIGIQTYTERALLRNRLLDESKKNLENYSIYAYVRPSPAQSYTFFIRAGHNSFTGDPARTMNIGTSVWLRLKNRLSLNLSYQKNNIDSDKLPLQDYLFSAIELTLPNMHSISLTSRWFKFENVKKEDYAFFAAYTVPFKIPAMKKRSFGSLQGKVIDRDQDSPVPIPNMILSIGDMVTVTNAAGEFCFPVLEPGRHQIKIDQRSMGMNRVATESYPIPVEIAGGETARQEIGIASACSISGKISLLALDPQKVANGLQGGAQQALVVMESRVITQGSTGKENLVEAGGLQRVLVELSNGDECLQQRTDEKGRFFFNDLRPGTWRLKISSRDLPLHHYLEKADFEIKLAHGGKVEIAASVLPRPRSIQLLQGGKIVAEHDAEKQQ